MTKLSWGSSGERRFEFGIDRGVLYSPLHMVELYGQEYPKGFAWNGLVSVNVDAENERIQPLYFDGVKTFDLVNPGDVSGSLKAFTHPDEFYPHDGYVEYHEGFVLDSQSREPFSLSYRTRIGNDVDGQEHGYKIHILYNLTAIPDTREYKTTDSNVEPLTMDWNLTCVPVKIDGYRPFAHMILDSTKIPPDVLLGIEAKLYGTDLTEPFLPSLHMILSSIGVVVWIDPEDSTRWYAFGPDELVYMTDAETFEINTPNVVYLDDDTYQISNN